MKDDAMTRKQVKRGIRIVIFGMILFISILMILFSCSVPESLTDHNSKDYKVIEYKYPYATVEVFYDTVKVIEYRYSEQPLAIGSYGISECRRVKK